MCIRDRGTLAGIEDEVNVSAEDSSSTHPEEVEELSLIHI